MTVNDTLSSFCLYTISASLSLIAKIRGCPFNFELKITKRFVILMFLSSSF